MVSSDLLSQDEINALLSGGMVGGDEAAPAEMSSSSSSNMSAEDEKALKEIGAVFSSSLQSVFGMLTGKEVNVTNLGSTSAPQVEIVPSIEPNPFVLRARCNGLDDAPIAIVIPQLGAQTLSDMMMGGEGKELSGVLSELDISASQEGLSQVLGSAFTNLSSKLNGSRLVPQNITALVEGDVWELFPGEPDVDVSSVKLHVSVPEVSDFDMFVVFPQSMAHSFSSAAAAASAPTPSAPSAPKQAPAQQAQQQPQFNLPPVQQQQSPIVDVRPAEFSPLATKGGGGVSNRIDLVADIPVRVTVELGRTRKNISEVLNMSAGSVIELDKMAGEPVDVLVNGKLIAKGEVVVIDENFGVRVTEIINSASRAYS